MRWLSPEIKATFNKYFMWGGNIPYQPTNIGDIAHDPAWVKVSGSGSYSKYKPKTPAVFTGALFCIYDVYCRAYSLRDVDPSDTTIYLQTKIVCHTFDTWGFNYPGNSEIPNADGFIDIGGIHWDPSKKNDQFPKYYDQLYFDYPWESWTQYTFAIDGVDQDIYTKMIGAMSSNISDTSSSQIATGGVDSPGEYKTFVYGLLPEWFDQNGHLLPAYSNLPIYWAIRGWDFASTPQRAFIYLEPTVSIDLDVDMNYIPWGIVTGTVMSLDMHNFGVDVPIWESCNRNPGSAETADKSGLYSKTSNGWELEWNSPIPTASKGFRIQSGNWEVSPITPES